MRQKQYCPELTFMSGTAILFLRREPLIGRCIGVFLGGPLIGLPYRSVDRTGPAGKHMPDLPDQKGKWDRLLWNNEIQA